MPIHARRPTQFVPYYINGLIPLSYQLPEDENLQALRDLYMTTIIKNQNLSGSPAAGWLGPHVGSALEYWPKYLAVEATESHAEALDPSAKTAVVEALVAHHRQFWIQASAGAPAFNQSKWGFARYSDAIAGIQWLLDNGQGATTDTSFLWDLMRLIRNQSDGVMGTFTRNQPFSWDFWASHAFTMTKTHASSTPGPYSERLLVVFGPILRDCLGFLSGCL